MGKGQEKGVEEKGRQFRLGTSLRWWHLQIWQMREMCFMKTMCYCVTTLVYDCLTIMFWIKMLDWRGIKQWQWSGTYCGSLNKTFNFPDYLQPRFQILFKPEKKAKWREGEEDSCVKKWLTAVNLPKSGQTDCRLTAAYLKLLRK